MTVHVTTLLAQAAWTRPHVTMMRGPHNPVAIVTLKAVWVARHPMPVTTIQRPLKVTRAVSILMACSWAAMDSASTDADGDGVCDEQEAFGCDQVGACNYNALATENDGSCDFVSCQGCTVPSACNYNPNATQNDGSCDLSGMSRLHRYQDALNYDATATEDNGSCLFDTTGGGDDTCPGDFTDDGVIGIADLLEFLIVFDSVCAE